MSGDQETKRKRTSVGWYDEHGEHSDVLSSLSSSSRQLPLTSMSRRNSDLLGKGGGGLSYKLTLGYVRGIHTRYKLESFSSFGSMYQCGCFRRVSVRFSRRAKVSYSIVNDRLMVRADLNVGNPGAEAEPQTPGAPDEPSQRRRQRRFSSNGKQLHIRLYIV